MLSIFDKSIEIKNALYVVNQRVFAYRGDPKALYEAGLSCLTKASYVYTDIKRGIAIRRATDWFRKAALQGHSGAKYELGEIYLNGKGQTIIDGPVALDWFTQLV